MRSRAYFTDLFKVTKKKIYQMKEVLHHEIPQFFGKTN